MSPLMQKSVGLMTLVLSAALWTGCATNLSKPASAPQPTKVKLSTYSNAVLLPVTIAPAFSQSSANQKAGRKINELTINQMKMIFPNLVVAEGGAPADAKEKKMLVIEPLIEEIKFIGGAARFWAGAMAGSSAVLMKVTYTDAATGEVIAAPQFYQQANAMGGGYSIGGTDNAMLSQIVQDVALYSKMNY